jgi:DNA-binding transcriptional ArsR family regulator
MESDQIVEALSALAQKSRLAVFRWLVQAGPQGGNPGDIALQLGLAPATLSFHLKTLMQARLVSATQRGRFICYRVDYSAMRALIAYLTENCCAGEPEKCAPGECDS